VPVQPAPVSTRRPVGTVRWAPVRSLGAGGPWLADLPESPRPAPAPRAPRA